MTRGSFYQAKGQVTKRSWAKRLAGVVSTSAAVVLSSQAFAACKYEIVNDWGSGFTASIIITNTTNATINGWNVSWQYAQSDRMTNGWNANFSGTNPYSASDFGWNGSLQPNQSVTIGFQGVKNGAAEIPVITGAICNPAGTSSSATAISSSVTTIVSSSSTAVISSSSLAAISSSSAVVSSSSSSVAQSSSVAPVISSASSESSVSSSAAAVWSLDADESFINFVTTTNINQVGVNQFTEISGEIEQGVAQLAIHLDSVETSNATANTQVRNHVFATTQHPLASISVNLVGQTLSLDDIAEGDTAIFSVQANVNLHGVTQTLPVNVSVSRLSESRLLVQSKSPVLVDAAQFNLVAGLDVLASQASLSAISRAVAVDFSLIFDAR